MLIFNPAASRSMVSILGTVRPVRMSDTVERGTPVSRETCRMVRFLLYITLSRSIFMSLFYNIIFLKLLVNKGNNSVDWSAVTIKNKRNEEKL